jgi:DNA-directed RNA polymerase subunit N (RpoN/RPB10)
MDTESNLLMQRNAALEKELAAKNRELEIEAAMERVRARAMAMRSSNELAEAAQLLYNELGAIGIQSVTCGYAFINAEEQSQTVWVTLPDGTLLPDYILFPLTGDPILNDRYKSWRNKEPLNKTVIEGEINKEHHRFLAPHVPPDIVKNIFAHVPDHIVFYSANFSAGYLMIIAREAMREDEEKIVLRFTKVFEITYTRFLDLQKAEAAAKEAQIEVALERVRSRISAMVKSSELAELMITIFNTITALGIPNEQIEVCYITTFDPVNPSGEIYLTNRIDGTFIPNSYTIPFDEDPLFKAIYKHWKNGDNFYVGHLEGLQLYDHFRYMQTHTSLPNTQSQEEIRTQLKETFTHALYFMEGYLAIVTRQSVASFHGVFKRFGNVLQQTYTRFLDLKKAEAQAREAQVQLALERVRARTMAMQKSEELPEAANLLYQQVQTLGLPVMSCGYNIWEKESKVCTAWMSDSSNTIQPSFKIPLTESPAFIRFWESRQRGEDFYAEEVSGEALAAHYKYMLSIPNFQKIVETFLKAGFTLPDYQINHVVNFSHGNLIFITEQPVAEAWDIFKRFGKVFEQTYIRFLDLQKAEAQAREAQIELALERVRARTMAMQHSDELQEAADLMFQQLQVLGIPAWTCGYNIWEKNEKVCTGWMNSKGANQPSFQIPLTENPTFIRFYDSRQKGELFYVDEKSGESLEANYRFMLTVPG